MTQLWQLGAPELADPTRFEGATSSADVGVDVVGVETLADPVAA